MDKYVCQICGHINLAEELPDNCPVCGAPKDKFKETKGAIKLPGDSSNKVESEKKHIPQITVNKECSLIDGCADIHARVGEIIHPMVKEHFIMYLDFYLDSRFAARLHLTPEKLNPAGCLHIREAKGKIAVISHCNVHGNWITETEL